MTDLLPRHFPDETWLRVLSAAVDQAGEAIILLEESNQQTGRCVVSVNRAFTEMTGYDREEIVGKTLHVLKGEQTDQAALDRIAAAMDRGERVTEELLNYRRDGTAFWAECTLAPVHPPGVPHPYWVSIQRDITDERDARRRLEESRLRYQTLVDFFPNGAIFLYDRDLRFVLAGGQGLAEMGLDPDEVVGRRLDEVLPAEHTASLRPAYRSALQGRSTTKQVVLGDRTFDTQFVPIQEPPSRNLLSQEPHSQEPHSQEPLAPGESTETGAPPISSAQNAAQSPPSDPLVADDSRPAAAGMIVAVDVTSRQEAERRLRESETRYRIVAENMRDLVVLHRLDGSAEWASPSVEHLLGYTPEAFCAFAPYELCHPDDADRVQRDAFDPILNGTPATRLTYRLRRRDGEYVWVETITRPVPGAGDRPVKLQATSRDVTERKAFEDELVQAKEHAERMNRLKSAFLANMSHEIRTPLTNVIGFADVLGNEVADAQQPFVEHIQRGGRRLLHTLNSVLDFAQLESETVRLRSAPVNLSAFVRETAEFFRPQAEQQDLDLIVEVPDAPVVAHTDEGALERVLGNLISNALKFTTDGTVTVCLRSIDPDDRLPTPGAVAGDGTSSVALASPGDAMPDAPSDLPLSIELEVSDTGVGIDEAFLPYLFAPFHQESTGFGRAFEGTGLGLSISARLAGMLGGRISVESEKGSGSTFRVRLPGPTEPLGDE
jgi:PAS domain S-box-containing protein